MESYTVKNGKQLRLGYTTGTCAAAAAKAAAYMLLAKTQIVTVNIITPSKTELTLEIDDIKITSGSVSCAVTKDAGDDPDVTHGMKIYACVSLCDNGIHIDGGEGIGRVTLPGLSIPEGEAAINPVPRRMITEELYKLLRDYPEAGGLEVIISAPGGEKIAGKTFNPRLGIIGGISVLGTSGIVMPMSEAAIIETIKLEMEMAYRRNNRALLLVPGNYGSDFAAEVLGLNPLIAVKCSNFIGEALDYAVYLGFDSVLLAGHTGKLLKLAAGIMNTHSRIADGRMEILAAHAAMAGAGFTKELMECVTTDAAFELLYKHGLTDKVLTSVGVKIAQTIKRRTHGEIKTAFVMFGKTREILCVSEKQDMTEIIALLRDTGEGQ